MVHCGSSDVFSYPEDDSVLDPLLAQHLAFFGIDFSSLQKVSLSFDLHLCLKTFIFLELPLTIHMSNSTVTYQKD